VNYEHKKWAIQFSNHSSRMFPFVNVALQAGLSGIIKGAALTGAKAAATNLLGQSVIHGIAVASGPVGWMVVGGVVVAVALMV
jgi:hypothetical protein